MSKKIGQKKINLGSALSELERITDELQSDDLDLEKSLLRFERGLQLAEAIRNRLSEVENKIKTIRLKYKDTLRENSE